MTETDVNQIEDIGNLGSEHMMYNLITTFSNEILNQYGDVIIEYFNGFEIFQHAKFAMSLSRVIKRRSFEYIIDDIFYGNNPQGNLAETSNLIENKSIQIL